MSQLIELQCKKCGGMLVATESAFTCPFCGMSYILNNITDYTTSIVNEEILNAEYVMQRFGDFKDAYSRFTDVVKKDPKDYRGYLGILKAWTKCFTDKGAINFDSDASISSWVNVSRYSFDDVKNKLYKSAPEYMLPFLHRIIDTYYQLALQRHDAFIAEIEKRHAEMREMEKAKRQRIEAEIQSIKQEIKSIEEQRRRVRDQIDSLKAEQQKIKKEISKKQETENKLSDSNKDVLEGCFSVGVFAICCALFFGLRSSDYFLAVAIAYIAAFIGVPILIIFIVKLIKAIIKAPIYLTRKNLENEHDKLQRGIDVYNDEIAKLTKEIYKLNHIIEVKSKKL